MTNSIYDFSVKDISGQERSLAEYRNKMLLIVNTASQCGFTPQYEGLQSLYDKYQAKGFEVLAFPCNQFGNQEPGGAEEIKSFCETRFHTTFPLFEKIDVNGVNASPLFNFLKESLPGFAGTKSIKWNFTKFLISKDGQPLQRFASKDRPEKLEADIVKGLA